MSRRPPDRQHNREQDSPEALRRTIDDLAETVAALGRKLDAEVGETRATTRHLAEDVVRMGEALVRRIETAPADRPAPIAPAASRRERVWLWTLILAIGLILAVLGVTAFPR